MSTPAFTSSMATERPMTIPTEPWRIVPFSNFATATALFVISISAALTLRTALLSRVSRLAASASRRSAE